MTDVEVTTRNEVVLVGRLSAAPREQELPSGDSFTSWRLVVDRPPGRRRPPAGVRPVTVDTLAAWAGLPGSAEPLRRGARVTSSR